jgi:hypothetical protein
MVMNRRLFWVELSHQSNSKLDEKINFDFKPLYLILISSITSFHHFSVNFCHNNKFEFTELLRHERHHSQCGGHRRAAERETEAGSGFAPDLEVIGRAASICGGQKNRKTNYYNKMKSYIYFYNTSYLHDYSHSSGWLTTNGFPATCGISHPMVSIVRKSVVFLERIEFLINKNIQKSAWALFMRRSRLQSRTPSQISVGFATSK